MGHTCDALKMALQQLETCLQRELIHHSDRGVQQTRCRAIVRSDCSNEYIKLLNGRNISISMTGSGDPLENAIAERVNGILKTEFLAHMHIPEKLDKAKQVIADIIHTYNHYRPHMIWNGKHLPKSMTQRVES
jgi:transposase InsO family protein